ncbi:MAG: M55 family metallopeptidase [Bacillaceae bacterium]
MKIYISVDIEGIAGTTHWNETEKNLSDWSPFAKQMTDELLAAIKGAKKAGATEIIVKDAHDSGRNIDISRLPEKVKLIRGWSGDPLCMITGLDESYDAVLFIGYHSAGGKEGNPLAHTLSTVGDIKINGEYASEFLIHTYAAALFNVPVAFISGDNSLMNEVREVNEYITTLPTKEGIGAATINKSPNQVIRQTKELVYKALSGDLTKNKVEIPEKFEVEIIYKDQGKAYRNAYYPGAILQSPKTVRYEETNYYEVLRMLNFLT